MGPFVMPSEDVGLGNSTATAFGRCAPGEETEVDADVETLKKAPGYVFYITAFFTMLWGIGIGSVYVANTAFYSALIPGAKESSYFGIKVLFAKTLTWLPPLLFGIINDKGELRYAI